MLVVGAFFKIIVMKVKRLETKSVVKEFKESTFFRSKTFYWLLLFILLYIISCKNNDEVNGSNANLLAVVIVDYKYEVEFYENNSNTVSILIPKSMEPGLMLQIQKIVESDKMLSEIYKELAGEDALLNYVEVMENTDKKINNRRLVFRD